MSHVVVYQCDGCGKEHREIPIRAAIYPAHLATSSIHSYQRDFCDVDCLVSWLRYREATSWGIASYDHMPPRTAAEGEERT